MTEEHHVCTPDTLHFPWWGTEGVRAQWDECFFVKLPHLQLNPNALFVAAKSSLLSWESVPSSVHGSPVKSCRILR